MIDYTNVSPCHPFSPFIISQQTHPINMTHSSRRQTNNESRLWMIFQLPEIADALSLDRMWLMDTSNIESLSIKHFDNG